MEKNNGILHNEIAEIHSIDTATNTNLLQAILESSSNVVIFALDKGYKYIAFNQEHKEVMQTIWGQEIELGMNMLDIITREDDYQKAKNLFDRALGAESFVDETAYGDEILSRKFWRTYYSPIYDETKKNIIGLTCYNLDITERRNIEIQMQMADIALNTITDAIYLVDEAAAIIYANQAACNSLGYSKEELIGKIIFDIDPMMTPDKISNIRETSRMKNPMQFETKHKRKDGTIFDVEITTYPHMDGQVGLSIVKDITDRKKTDEKLKLLASVFTSAKEGIVITDTSGIILDVNEAYSLITGYSKNEVIGQNAGFLKSDKHEIEFYKRMWSELVQNKYWIGEIWNRRKNGEIFVERLTISAISDSEDKTSSYVGLLTDITMGKDYESTLERMAFYDSLTGLPNRMLLSERINQAMTFTKRLKNMMAVCYLDLDGFKPVNDNFGHSIGDKLLIEVANRMQKCIRESDTVARIGGDEFAILLLNVTNNEECEITVSKILESINEPYIINNIMSINVTASIGITLYPQDASSSDLLLRHADQAMYLAKESGKNKYIFHS